MGVKMSRMLKQVDNTVKTVMASFGKVSSGNNKYITIRNTISGDMRDIMMVAPFGITSCPPSDMFAQMIINDNTNNVCVGVHDPNAQTLSPGDVMIYNGNRNAYIRINNNGSIQIVGTMVTVNGTQIPQPMP